MNDTEALWQDHKARMRAYIALRVHDRDAVDDILQEVFLKTHASHRNVRAHGSITAWLYRVAANAIADHFRAKRPWDNLPEELAAPEPEPDYVAELASCLRPLIDDLPETYQSALVLSELEGLPQKEVATRLGISLSGAKSRVQRGREKLRERILRCCDIETGRTGIVNYVLRENSGNHCGRGTRAGDKQKGQQGR